MCAHAVVVVVVVAAVVVVVVVFNAFAFHYPPTTVAPSTDQTKQAGPHVAALQMLFCVFRRYISRLISTQLWQSLLAPSFGNCPLLSERTKNKANPNVTTKH